MNRPKDRSIPARHELVEFNYAVAGHAGTMCDADGELFVKPCTPREIAWYSSVVRRHHDFYDLMPHFYGTLSLNEATDAQDLENGVSQLIQAAEAGIEAPAASALHQQQQQQQQQGGDNVTWVPNNASKIKTDLAVVLANATHGFKKPNILDTKLGVRLWADDAPLEKKTRFDKISRETTHGELGFRIAGMRAYRGSEDRGELDEEEYKIYDKDFGRTRVSADNIVDSFRLFIFNRAADIDEDLGRAVAGAFLRELRRVEEVLAKHESRMYSSSLLFVFEGDGEALRAAISDNNRVVDEVLEKTEKVCPSAARVDSGISLSDSEDGFSEHELPKIFTLKLIDFAHAQWTPGQGCDENTLTGVRSLIRIFEEMAGEDSTG